MIAADEQFSLPSIDSYSLLSIEQVAARTGLTKRTLRYYEEVGLLPPTGRTEGNYRRYSEEDIQRLDRIMKLRDLLGFSLADIRKLLDSEDERGQIKVAYQLHLIEQKMEGLEQMRTGLLAKIEQHQYTREELLKEKI